MVSPTKNITPSVLWYYALDDAGAKQLNFIAFAATMEENHAGQATVSKYPVQKGFEVSNHLIRHNKRIQIRAYIPEAIIGGIDVEGADSGFALGAMANKYLGVDFVNTATIVGGIVTDPFGVASNYLEGAVSAVAPQVKAITDVADSVASKVDSWFGTTAVSDAVGSVTGQVNKFIPSNSRRINAFQKIQDIQDKGYVCCLGTVLKEYSDLVLVDYSVPTTLETMSCMFVDLVFEQVLVVDKQGNQTVNLSMDKVTDAEKDNALDQSEKFFDSEAANWFRYGTDWVKDKIGLGDTVA